jgi:nucleoside-diphosphate-sugar epimerase
VSRVLVAGCGYVGTALGRELAAGGDTVFGLRRDPSRLPAAIAPVAADLSQPASLATLPEVDAVVYTAAANGFSESAYRAAYVDGLRNLVEALAAGGPAPRRLIFVSSTSVYAQQDGEWVDEDSPADADHWSARALLAGERRAREGAAEAIVLRLGGIYGPGRTRLVDEALAGATYAAGAPRYTNRIHRDDAAGALAYLLRHPAPDPLYLGVDDEPAELRVVLEWLADKLGAPPPRAALAGGDDPRRERSNKRCSNAKLRSTGYAFKYPTFRDGYSTLIGAG